MIMTDDQLITFLNVGSRSRNVRGGHQRITRLFSRVSVKSALCTSGVLHSCTRETQGAPTMIESKSEPRLDSGYSVVSLISSGLINDFMYSAQRDADSTG